MIICPKKPRPKDPDEQAEIERLKDLNQKFEKSEKASGRNMKWANVERFFQPCVAKRARLAGDLGNSSDSNGLNGLETEEDGSIYKLVADSMDNVEALNMIRTKWKPNCPWPIALIK
jgi:hypothetical protein